MSLGQLNESLGGDSRVSNSTCLSTTVISLLLLLPLFLLLSSLGRLARPWCPSQTPSRAFFPPLFRRNAPRARSGPLERSSHGGQQLQQRRGSHPDLRRLLAAFSAPPLRQTP